MTATTTLTPTQTTRIKSRLEEIYTGDNPSDRDDVLDYIIAMLTNGKTVPNVLDELEGIVDGEDLKKIGVCLQDFLTSLVQEETEVDLVAEEEVVVEQKEEETEDGVAGKDASSRSSTIKSLKAVKEVSFIVYYHSNNYFCAYIVLMV